jgi:hypothetical protein
MDRGGPDPPVPEPYYFSRVRSQNARDAGCSTNSLGGICLSLELKKLSGFWGSCKEARSAPGNGLIHNFQDQVYDPIDRRCRNETLNCLLRLPGCLSVHVKISCFYFRPYRPYCLRFCRAHPSFRDSENER